MRFHFNTIIFESIKLFNYNCHKNHKSGNYFVTIYNCIVIHSTKSNTQTQTHTHTHQNYKTNANTTFYTIIKLEWKSRSQSPTKQYSPTLIQQYWPAKVNTHTHPHIHWDILVVRATKSFLKKPTNSNCELREKGVKFNTPFLFAIKTRILVFFVVILSAFSCHCYHLKTEPTILGKFYRILWFVS